MRIITWNVNGIRAVEKKGEIQNLIQISDPDILFLQEIKGSPNQFSSYLQHPHPYAASYNPASKAGYAGTGVWIHDRMLQTHDISFFSSFPDDPTADEGRVAHIRLTPRDTSQQVIHIFGIYFPNGGKSETAWHNKLVFYKNFTLYAESLRESGAHVLWGGDINCAHQAIDLARPRENDGKIGFHPLERSWLDQCQSDGWHDIWRTKNPTTPDVYSWWDVITRSRDRNVGWRIDALWGDAHICAKTTAIEYLTQQFGSDHCPLLLDLEI